MNSKKIIYFIALVAAFAVIFGLGAWFESRQLNNHIAQLETTISGLQSFVKQPGNVDFALFWNAYEQLQQNYMDPSKIDNQKVVYGAIDGMTNSLGDPYTEFFTPAQAQRFQQDLTGSFEGIGVEVDMKNGFLTVVAPLKGTPGEKAGLKSGDIIMKIGGQDTSNMNTDEAVNLIRGPRGTSVTLSIFRDGWSNPKDFKITRDTINVPLVEWSIKNSDVAYVKINQFDQNLSADFKKTALEILQSPAKKIVLDLRNNPGGYLETAQDVAGWFLKNGQTITIEDFGKGKIQQTFKANGNANFANYPMVVLINQGSASASEILAGALRDDRNIKLIGTKSFGKGCVQEVFDLPGGSFLKITIANWLTPKGGSISNVGLAPDVKVDLTDQDIQAQKDPQLDKALEIIQTLH